MSMVGIGRGKVNMNQNDSQQFYDSLIQVISFGTSLILDFEIHASFKSSVETFVLLGI